MHTMSRLLALLLAPAIALGCSVSEGHANAAPPALQVPAAPQTSAVTTTIEPLGPVPVVYPWGPSATAASLDNRLDGRFRSPPPGFARVTNAPGSFGEFLRTLPLQPEGAPVVDFRGTKLYADGKHENIVAVADLDIGSKDLQHCADVILRLHAEWRYGKGERDIRYKAVSGQTLSYRGWMNGDRSLIEGKSMVIRHAAAAHKDDHDLFRGWLDDVFSWAGTASLERDAPKVARADLAPGDFFVMSGSPFGHAVLILDVAKDDKGRTALLLGQSYMPAQSFQILRPAATGSAWFVVEPADTDVATPFWKPFPMNSLRRL